LRQGHFWWCCTDDANGVLKLYEMSEDEQLQWAMKESVKSSTNAANIIVPLPSNGLYHLPSHCGFDACVSSASLSVPS